MRAAIKRKTIPGEIPSPRVTGRMTGNSNPDSKLPATSTDAMIENRVPVVGNR